MTSDPLTVPAAIDQPASKHQLLMLRPTERLRSISAIFLFPQTVRTALEQLEYVFHSRGRGLSANILLTGADHLGKSALIRYFLSRHPPVPGDDVFDEQPVVITTPTSRADAVGLAEAILGDGGWPQSLVGMGAKLPELQINMFLRKSNTRILFLNRATLLAGRGSSITHSSAVFLSNLMDQTDTSTALVGEENLLDLIDDCKILRKRFRVRLELNPIKFGPRWTALLSSIEQRLPFERTDLLLDDMPLRLHIASEGGKIPVLMDLTFDAASFAILAKHSPNLTRAHFLAAFSHQCKGVNPFGDVDPEFARLGENDPARSDALQAVRANNRSSAK
jgi:hypothetical protein